MKTRNKFLIPVISLAVISLSLISFKTDELQEKKVDMPENIHAIIEKSCMGCHNTTSKNDKAKNKLRFDTLNELTDVKKIKTLSEIVEVLEENEMPPEKFLKRYPDRALTGKEEVQLKQWAQKQAKAIINK